MEFFPTNTAQKFKTRLANQISLNGEWEVGLFEFEYRRSWYTVDQTTGVFEYHFAVGAEKYCETIRLPPGYYNIIK